MLRSAVLKLTLSYLTIIMVLSIGFSFVLYRISLNELAWELRAPTKREQAKIEDFLNFRVFRTKRFDQAVNNLKQNIFFLNLGMLAVGGFASYLLAKRTLQPIEESMEAQTRFTADASHELRTPLTAMQTEIEVALRDKKLTKEDAAALLKSNLEEVVKLKALSNNLLKLAHQDSSDLVLKTVSLQKVSDEAVKQLLPVASSKKIALLQKAGKLRVKGDHESLRELAVILIDNAIKYSKPNTKVEITTSVRGQCANLVVTDHGSGILPSDLPHIFDRFYRVDKSRSKDSSGGYGLGLSIAKQIVDLHGGNIEVKSTPGQGSIFTVVLPLIKSGAPRIRR